MNGVNEFEILGHLTKDPDIKYTTTGTALTNIVVAVDSVYGEKKRTDFPRISVFGKTAENLGLFSGKGLKVLVKGRIQTGTYEKDGKTVYTTDLVADRVIFLDFKQEEPTPHIDGDFPF